MRIYRPSVISDRPGITVVIPCYRYGRYLKEAVGAVLDQDGVEARVIIVDDASPDDSADIARALSAEDPRISVVVHETNKGHIQTYNDGLALVETEFVSLVSADDLVTPGSLLRACSLMRRHPTVGLVYGHPLEFLETLPRPPATSRIPETWTVWSGREWIGWMCRRGRCFIMSPEVVMRTAALREVGEYSEHLPHSGDLEYWIRSAAAWDIGRVNGPPQAYYRVHGGNMHLTTFATMLVDYRGRRAAFDVLESARIRALVGDATWLNARARRALARESLILATREVKVQSSGDDPWSLIDFAEEVSPSPRTRRRVRAARNRVSRQLTGQRPTRGERLAKEFRHQLDRVRWHTWHLTGIS